MKKLSGLVAAPFTPMDEQGELAFGQVERLVTMYRQNGVAGAFIAGTTGECVSLSLSEKMELMSVWGAAKTDDLQLIFMLGGTCLKDMQTLARAAAQKSMDRVAMLCPYYFRPASVEILVDFCAKVAATVPDLPFYYYHIPSLTGGHFSMLRFLELAEVQIPNLAGIKYTHSNIMEFQACLNFRDRKYEVMWGTDEALLSALVVGADTAVGSTYNYAAPLYHLIMEAFREKRFTDARQLQFQSVRMVELLEKYGGIGAGKAFMKLIDMDCGWFRPPVSKVSPSDYEALKSELTTLGFFEFCNRISE